MEDFKKEINKKKSELLDLKEKSNRIEKKVQAMKKYEDLLERVKNEYPDEFPELNDILNRYNTLYESNTRLKDQQTSMEKDLNSTRLQKTDYDKQKTNEILSLNNKIAIFQKNLEVLYISKLYIHYIYRKGMNRRMIYKSRSKFLHLQLEASPPN